MESLPSGLLGDAVAEGGALRRVGADGRNGQRLRRLDAESEATKAEIARADAPIHPRKCFMPPCRQPVGRFGRQLNPIHCAGRDDWPMNGSLRH